MTIESHEDGWEGDFYPDRDKEERAGPVTWMVIGAFAYSLFHAIVAWLMS